MAHVIIVTGLAVRSYTAEAAAALSALGHRVELLSAPAWRDQDTDLEAYGRRLARRIDDAGTDIDLVIGLSVGTQVVAVAAAGTRRIRRLLLIGPTMAPRLRTRRHAIRTWMQGDPHPDGPGALGQAPDWLRAGLPNIYRGLESAIRIRLEDVLAAVHAEVTIVHPDSDLLSPLDFAATLADQHRARLLIVPDAPHSWPVGDVERFCDLVTELLTDSIPAREAVDPAPGG